MNSKIKPDMKSEAGKKQQVEAMFDSISGRYDFLNRFLSLGIDQQWRKKAIASISEISPLHILDVATGTADLAIAASSKIPQSTIKGIDISEGMLSKGRDKIAKKGLTQTIQLERGDSEHLPFKDHTFDAVTVGFGVRNFESLEQGLSEIHRVLKPGGKLAVLEFSKPTVFPVKQVYNLYFKTILPLWGRFISGSNNAYTYLPESVQAFPDGHDFIAIMEEIGFKTNKQEKLTFGICSLYTGIKG